MSDDLVLTPFQASFLRARRQSGNRVNRNARLVMLLRERWICFAALAEHLAPEPGDIVPVPARRSQAYWLLAQSVVAREFDEEGRTCVALLPVRWDSRPRLRLDVHEFRRWCASGAPDHILANCYAPRRLFDRWLAARAPGRPLAGLPEAGNIALFVRRPEMPPPTHVSGTIRAENECQKWLAALMRAGLPSQRRQDYQADAAKKFGIGLRAFGRAWAAAIRDTNAIRWRQPGRKSKR